MPDALTTAAILIVTVFVTLVVFSIIYKRTNHKALIQPLFNSVGGIFMLALIFSLTVALNLLQSGVGGVYTTIAGILLLFILFYVAVVPSSNPRIRLALYVLVCVIVFDAILETTEPWSPLVILIVFAMFIGVFMIGFRRFKDNFQNLKGLFNTIEKDYWIGYFLLAGAFISNIFAFVQYFQDESTEKENKVRWPRLLMTILVLVLLIVYTVVSYTTGWRAIFRV